MSATHNPGISAGKDSALQRAYAAASASFDAIHASGTASTSGMSGAGGAVAPGDDATLTRGSAERSRAVVLLSGGLDSATVLAIARSQSYECYALSVDYGQRHVAELNAAVAVARALGAKEHRVMRVDLANIGGSALTDTSIAVPDAPSAGIPITYVPARNTIMLSLALAWAEVLQAQDVFVGVNAVDYSGYPDCRPEFIAAFESLAKLATRAGVEGQPLHIHAPLIRWSKAEIIRQGTRLGVDYSLTVSCYQADPEGRACGVCDSCRLRKEGFAAADLRDPTRYRPL